LPKVFTFDYDCRIIANRNVNIDKLQPTNFQINASINENSEVLNQLKEGDELPKYKISNKLADRETKEITGDKAIKPTRDN
jgi:hypothetical protein